MESLDETKGIAFDELFYLERYPDVARTIGPGGWSSGLDHYLRHGRSEGRQATRAPKAKGPDLDAIRAEYGQHQAGKFLSPASLSVTKDAPLRLAMIGSCMLRAWDLKPLARDCLDLDLFVVNFLSELPAKTRSEIAEYDFAVVQIPLRSVISDALLWNISYRDGAAHEAAFENCCARMETQLRNWMCWNREYGLLTFVCNFLVPQSNTMGRLLARYDLRNDQYFIEQLNVQLEKMVRRNQNAYIFDVDRISASVGRRYTQDDVVAFIGHNTFLGSERPINNRIEPVARLAEYYPSNWLDAVRPAIWAELIAMHRTVRQIDLVKLVVVDLDDTLWEGVSGEMEELDPDAMTEGWPLGFVEALMYLKKRGILLAIVSKNEDERIRTIFSRIWGKKLKIEHFAAVKINWRPKAENMAEILATMNLLPRNVVFIDDNPVERAAMLASFPEMRVLGRHLYWLRRVLLWSSETEVTAITEEATQKTQMMQRQFERENQRKSMSRDDFLRSAAPRVDLFNLPSVEHSRFQRILELMNKTNQFNTTGKRWKAEELKALLLSGGQIFAFSAEDAFTAYGLVGVVVIEGRRIVQWVMSCRVLGYEIERAVMHAVIPLIEIGPDPISGTLIETESNFPSRCLFSSCGFEKFGNDWRLPNGASVSAPDHVNVTLTA